nr:unnamed protein product [Digitaria exilis]
MEYLNPRGRPVAAVAIPAAFHGGGFPVRRFHFDVLPPPRSISAQPTLAPSIS